MLCLKSHFPITLEGNWQQPQPKNFSSELSSWLLDESSLTKRLTLNSNTFRVELLGQKVMP